MHQVCKDKDCEVSCLMKENYDTNKSMNRNNDKIGSVNQFLEAQNIVVFDDVNDTIRLKIIINNKGILAIESIQLKPETAVQIPEIENLLRESLKEIPKIYPAIKRGQQVTTAFELPVIVRIN